MSVSRLCTHQSVLSYRGQLNGSNGLMRQPKRTRLQNLRHRLLNPHPAIMVKSIIESSGGRVTLPVPATKLATLVDGLQYGVASSILPPVGYTKNLKQENLPISACYQSALKKQDPMQLDLGTNLGEMRETISMLRSPLRSLASLLREVIVVSKKQRFKRRGAFRTMSNALASTWLEYRYGVMPLVYTVVDILKLLDNIRGVGLYVTKGSHPPVTSSSVTLSDVVVGDFIVKIRQQRVWESKATVIIAGSPDYHYSLLDALGLRVTNVPFIALELTKLSFVLEWFVDVNGFLRQIIPFENRYIHNYQVCIKHSVIETFTDDGTFCLYQGNQRTQSSGAVVTRTYEMLDRAVNPPIDVKLNIGSGISSVKRALDAISLGLKPTLDLISKLRRG